MEHFFIYLFYIFSYIYGQLDLPGSMEDKFMKELMTEQEDSDMPIDMVVEENSLNVKINCRTNPGVTRIVWRIETISERKFIAVIAENGRVSSGWKDSHAINASLHAQNTLVIKKASMKNAGKYSCQLYYNDFTPKSYLAEVIITSIDPNTGKTLAPSGYFKWELRYNGNLKPFFRCSNGEVLNGVEEKEKEEEDSFIKLIFNGCFMDELPEECTLMTADYFNNRFAVFKIFNMTQEFPNSKYAGSRSLNASEKVITFSESLDRVISIEEGSVLEFKCDFSPSPDAYSWVFKNPDRECSAFEEGVKHSESRVPFKYHIISPTLTSSHFIIFHFGASAAGKYLCIGTYWTDGMRREHTAAELTMVVEHDELVSMHMIAGGTENFIVKFEITYRGNLKPFLQCSSVRIETEKSILNYQNIQAFFNSEIVLLGVPVACKCYFRNENTNKEVFFKDIYVKLELKLPGSLPDLNNFPVMKAGEEYDMLDVPGADENYIEVPKNIVVTKTKHMATFTCQMDLEAVSLTWEFTSLLRDFKGAIIFQTKVGVSPYVDQFYRVDTSQNGVYTLVVRKIVPKTVGTYKCSLFYTDKPSLSYSVQLVIAKAHSMNLLLSNSGVKSKAKFSCVVEYFGKMQPFLKCTSQLELFPVKLLNYKETFTKVLFQKELNYTQLPFQCDVWFKDEEANSVLFQLGETRVQHARVGMAVTGSATSHLCPKHLKIINVFATFLFILY